MNLVQKYKLVNGCPVTTTNAGITCDYISLKDAIKVTIIADLKQAVGHATVLGINEATAVAGTGAQAVTAVQRVWKNDDQAATDTLVRQTDAATATAANDVKNKHLVIEFDPATLSAGFDCIAATLSASSQASNFAVVNYLIEYRYPQATPPTAIVD